MDEVGPSVLLMNKDRLLRFLNKNGYDQFWAVLGEKDVIGGGGYPGDLIRRNRSSGF